MNYHPVMVIASECVRRGFEEYGIAANSLPGMPIAPCSGHNGVTSSKLRNLGVCGHGLLDTIPLLFLLGCRIPFEQLAHLYY
jgi:hypothetical protein